MIRRRRSISAIGVAIATAGLLLASAVVPAAASPAGGHRPHQGAATPGTLEQCESLASFAYPQTRITLAETVPAGLLDGVVVGEHCLVRGQMNERVSAVDGQAYAIAFEMRLPTDWSGRYLYQANGGIDGSVATALGSVGGGENGLQMGFAVISSDAGHTGAQNPTFGLDPQARLDYGYQAVGSLTPMAKQLIAAGYGRGPDRSYMTGGSNGGRHTLVAAARYADQYDGFLALAPGFNLPKAAVAQVWGAQRYATVATSPADLSTALTPAERATIAGAVGARCDALDGLADGMVQASSLCQRVFSLDRDVPTCATDRDGTCLTQQQKAVVTAIFAGARTSGGEPIYSSFPFDPGIVQGGWAFWEFIASVSLDPAALGYIFTTPPDAPALSTLRDYALTVDTDAAAAKIYATSGIYTESAMSFMTPPNPTKLDTLRDSGGKMIVVHGAADGVFSPDDTASWYEGLQAQYHRRADRFVRYFEVPGMGHVQGGPATDRYAALAALVNWVEGGTAPQRLVASLNPANPEVPASWAPGLTRPLCPYPTVALYTGGDANNADSFACKDATTPVNITAPSVTGDPDVGRVLTANAGEWTSSNTAFRYQWLRDGKPIAKATGSTYTVRFADQGRALSVSVTARAGGSEATAVSAPVTVRRAAVALVTTSPAIAKTTRPVTVVVRILASGVAATGVAATGTVSVKVAGQTFTGTVENGRASVPVGTLPKGVHRITASYSGDPAVSPTTGYGAVLVVK